MKNKKNIYLYVPYSQKQLDILALTYIDKHNKKLTDLITEYDAIAYDLFNQVTKDLDQVEKLENKLIIIDYGIKNFERIQDIREYYKNHTKHMGKG